MTSRLIPLALIVLSVLSIPLSSALSGQERLIWNRTSSAPEGLYWRRNSHPARGDWVIVSPESPMAVWAEAREFTGRDWPLIKRVAAKKGDRVCRSGAQILINQVPVARALATDSSGESLPVWEGCKLLSDAEYFLVNAHPASLDGRYFGPTAATDSTGVAVPIWTFER